MSGCCMQPSPTRVPPSPNPLSSTCYSTSGSAASTRRPHPDPVMAPSNRTDGPGVYVALGDSISIDRYAGGEGRGGASLLTRNRDDDFPQWRGRDLATLSHVVLSPARHGWRHH